MCADKRDTSSVWVVEEPQKQNSVADYDKAVEATGYGLFNILLLLAALPVGWTCIIDTTSTAFIINSTECVFELTMLRRGIAFSTIFIGMIIAGPIWDFLLQDSIIGRLGKRNVIIIGMLIDVMCNITWIHTSSYYMFIGLKFISGLLIAGPLSVVMAYLAEFHAPKYQKEFTRWAGLAVGISYIMPAALAVVLFLRTPWFHFTFNNYFYPTWRVYLIICALPSIMGLWLLCLLPKSPKFLMSQGKNQEALHLLRAMYSLNHLKSPTGYPISQLGSSQKKIEINFKDKLRERISNLKTLISKPYLSTISILLILQFISMFGFNVMRLWVPPVFVILNNFRVLLRSYYPKNEFITMCDMIFPRIDKLDHTACNYTLPSVESAVYVNSTIIASSAVTFGFIFALLCTTKFRRIVLITLMFLLSAVGSFASNWAIEIPYMLVLLAFIIVGCRIAGNTILAYNAEVIPPALRPTAVSIINLIGNLGAAGGNIIFSSILEIDCLSSFFIVGFLTMVGGIIGPVWLTKLSTKKVKNKSTEVTRF